MKMILLLAILINLALSNANNDEVLSRTRRRKGYQATLQQLKDESDADQISTDSEQNNKVLCDMDGCHNKHDGDHHHHSHESESSYSHREKKRKRKHKSRDDDSGCDDNDDCYKESSLSSKSSKSSGK